MRLTFQEIRQRAVQFGHDWKDETSERAEAQTFWNEFFSVFGIHRRSVASFERTVKNLQGAYDRIDVIWQGVLIGEHKSAGQDLGRAATQALGYVQSLTREERDSEIPRYIIVSDFARIGLHDLEATEPALESVSFPVEDLHKHIRRFDFLNGIQSKPADPEDPINIEAVEVLGRLHDELERSGYAGHQLERFLVRILFCVFADDTGIFEPDTFKSLVEQARDGADLGPRLERFFRVLDTPEDKRTTNLPEGLGGLPYVNGHLFGERLDFADFNDGARNALLAASRFQWAKISPAVFGSLFQSIMAGETGARRRRQIGAHYTSERDILKLIRSLFLDDLRAEFEKLKVKAKRSDLLKFHDSLAGLKFLDPACGCGNFLVVAYRELRRLEHELIDALFPDHALIDIVMFVRINVDCMHGIEIEEWPARIAEVAMWLIDHQLNLEASQRFGKPLLRLPLKTSAKIVHANALRIDWNDVVPAKDCAYVMGNPPFVGKQFMTAEQNMDVALVAGHIEGNGVLDYVTMWHLQAARYIEGTRIETAYVSTNSVSQGEQVAILWGPRALGASRIRINFAYRTFSWQSEARGKAHVHVVIIGFAMHDRSRKFIWEQDDAGRDVSIEVRQINAYLADAPEILIPLRTKSLCSVPPIVFGSMPNEAKPKRAALAGLPEAEIQERLSDQLLLNADDKDALLQKCPDARKWLRRIYGSEEFINGIERWCLWLVGISPSELKAMPEVMRRVEQVKRNRLTSTRSTTRVLADTPWLFGENRQPTTRYLLIPSVSSELRPFIPMDFMDPRIIASNLALVVPGASLYHFGILSSTMHMAWVRQVCGRLKSDYRYSNKLVYNNYPWPTEATNSQQAGVETAAQGVLDARAAYPGETLADLYDPLAMPKNLRNAHRALDRAVDKCYRPQAFAGDRQRVEYLFGLYEKLTAPLIAPDKTKGVRKKKKD